MAQKAKEKLKAQLGIEFIGIEAEIKKLAPFMVKAGKALPMELRKGLKKVNQDIKQIGELLERATEPETLTTLRQAMADVAKEAAKVGNGMAKAAVGSGKAFQVAQINKTTGALKQLNKTLVETQKAKRRTALMSQNMLRIMQDSPFGILGMANNIQMLGESLSHAMKKGDTFFTAMKAGLKDLFMGPMAFAMIITVATLIAQKWDMLSNAAIVLTEKLKGISEAQRTLNKRMRDFSSLKPFEEMIKSLKTKDLEEISDDLRRASLGLGKTLRTIEESIAGQEKVPTGKFSRSGQILYEYNETARQLIELQKEYEKAKKIVDERSKANHAERTKRADKDALLRQYNQDTADDRRDQQQRDKEDSEERRRLTQEAKSEFKSALMRLKGFDRRYDDAVAAEEKRTAKELVLEKERNTAILKLRREFLIAQRKMTADLSAGVRLSDLKGAAIGVGAVRQPSFDAGPKELIQHEQDKLAAYIAANQKSVDARQSARTQLDIWMQAAGANNDAEELKRLTAKHDELEAQEDIYSANIIRMTKETAEKIAQINNRSLQRQIAAMGDFSGQIGNLFGGMADIMATEGEKGLEQNKSMLKAQAWAQAISASIGIFNNVATTPGLGPFAYAAAGAAMAATMVTLSAQIKKIDNPGGGASGRTVSGGAFTALNSATTAQRASNFQRSEDRRNSAGIQGAAASASNTEELLSNINEGIRTQKVVIDQATIADVERGGKTINTRRVQTSN